MSVKANNDSIEQKVINTLRFLSVDAVEEAKSGHPGLPLGAAPMAYVVWARHMRHNPANPAWFNRDRFVLSAGHGSALLYSLLHLFGYQLPIEELKRFRQWGSMTPGHPEYRHTPGVETTTGPLGQGFGNAVGMAIAERYISSSFNRPGYQLVDHYTYVIAGDGDMMEGITSESASLAGHLGLYKLICLYDDNKISIDGPTSLAFSENVEMRFQAYGWNTIRVKDGNDFNGIDFAISDAKSQKEKPTLILISTTIGFGSPNKAGMAEVHGSPLGVEEVRLTKRNLCWPEEPAFYIPPEVSDYLKSMQLILSSNEKDWFSLAESYSRDYPELWNQFMEWVSGAVPTGMLDEVNSFDFGSDKLATREASGKVIGVITKHMHNIIGGSADLTPSNNTNFKESGDFGRKNPSGRYIRFGVREHGMGAILNGIVLHGGMRAYGGTFLVFSDYMRPSIRLSALMKIPVIYIFTHDTIGLGEDGPTHQPIEHLMTLRAIHDLKVIRPADANEAAGAWKIALESKLNPVALILSRQKLPVLSGTKRDIGKGAYILKDNSNLMDSGNGEPDIILISSGSEVPLMLKVHSLLEVRGYAARSVSMPSWELFESQDIEFKENILPPKVRKRVSIEAGITMGWERFIGNYGLSIGIDTYGASAPGDVLMDKFGFSAENISDRILKYFG